MPTIYLESFGAYLSENELLHCVSILLTGTSTSLLPCCAMFIVSHYLIQCCYMSVSILKRHSLSQFFFKSLSCFQRSQHQVKKIYQNQVHITFKIE